MKHPATSDFASLITDAIRFKDVEQRIEALPTEKERGDAMEVFAEAYLRTIWATQIKEVWPETTIPPSLNNAIASRPVTRVQTGWSYSPTGNTTHTK